MKGINHQRRSAILFQCLSFFFFEEKDREIPWLIKERREREREKERETVARSLFSVLCGL
jgi:hypothetical protein